MNLKEMGETFRRERERLGLTIEDVVQKTKISKTNILALEAGDMDGLPHPVYAKGFARNYARLLKLDPEECASAMGREFVAYDNVAPEAEDHEAESQPAMPGTPGKGVKLLLLALALVTVVGGGALFMLTGKDKEPAPEAPVVTAPAPAEVREAPAEPEPQAAPEAVQEAPADEVQEAPAPAEAQPAPVVQHEVSAVQPEPAPAQAHLGTDPGSGPADGRQRVVVTARESCWILAHVDGGDGVANGVTVDVMLQPGQSKLLRFHHNLEVKLGNGGGVDVTLNGGRYSFTAESGQVKTLTFNAP